MNNQDKVTMLTDLINNHPHPIMMRVSGQEAQDIIYKAAEDLSSDVVNYSNSNYSNEQLLRRLSQFTQVNLKPTIVVLDMNHNDLSKDEVALADILVSIKALSVP